MVIIIFIVLFKDFFLVDMCYFLFDIVLCDEIVE